MICRAHLCVQKKTTKIQSIPSHSVLNSDLRELDLKLRFSHRSLSSIRLPHSPLIKIYFIFFLKQKIDYKLEYKKFLGCTKIYLLFIKNKSNKLF